MLKKRIIPCLDVQNGRTVKGINFLDLIDSGDPIEMATKYAEAGADELVFLDITATIERRKPLVEFVRELAGEIDIPFTVGGGISDVAQGIELLRAGADKIAINSAAVGRSQFIYEISSAIGSQSLVVAVDVKNDNGSWVVHTHGGRTNANLDAIKWIKQIVHLGAGELLLTSMNQDGTKQGFDLALYKEVEKNASVPIIASGGAGTVLDFVRLFEETTVTGGLAASIFHTGTIPIQTLKKELIKRQIPIRCN